MPAPSKKTPERLDRIRSLHQAGRSTHEIGEDLGLPHQTIGRWMRELGLRPNVNKGRRASRQRPDLPQPQAPEAVQAPSLPLPDLTDLPVDLDVAQELRRRHAQIRAAMDQTFRAATTTGANLGIWQKLAGLEIEYSEAITKLLPPPPRDPETDPINVEAANRLHGMLTKLVHEAEQKSRCMHCGRPPFSGGR